MMRVSSRVDRRAVAALVLCGAAASRAQGTDLPLAFFQHTSWTGEAGPPRTRVHGLARTHDGYVWLGARDGLVRFDGTRFVVIDSGVTPALRSAARGLFIPLFVDREGWLWISRPDFALVKYRDGVFAIAHYPEANVGGTAALDSAGIIWLNSGAFPLRVLRAGRAERPLLPRGVPDTSITGIVADTGKGVWIGTDRQGLWHVTATRAEHLAPPHTRQPWVRPIRQTSDGVLWVADERGLFRNAGGTWRAVTTPAGETVAARFAEEDDSHALWIATNAHGVLRWRNGVVEQFTKSDGLSDATVDCVLAARDGSVWVLTTGGLDRLRPAPFARLDSKHGLPFDAAYRFAEDRDGSLWGRALGARGTIVEVRGRWVDHTRAPTHSVVHKVPLIEGYEILGAAHGGGVWLGPSRGGLARYYAGTLTQPMDGHGIPPDRFWQAIETHDGALWLANALGGGFGRVRNGRYKPMALPGSSRSSVVDATEDDEGHLWVAAAGKPLLYEFAGDSLVRRVGPADGLHDRALALAAGRGDTLWGLVDNDGVLRITGSHVSVVRVPALRPAREERLGIVASGSALWIAGSAIARVSIGAINAAMDSDRISILPRFFGAADGLSTPRTTADSPSPIFRARDGRVWISTPTGLVVTDPSHQFIDSTPPRLHVEELLSAGRRIPLELARIAPHPTAVSIRYTAISGATPERTRVQYRLDGVNDSWVDGEGPRLATYTQLRPGTYVFRLRAWNADGVMSQDNAALRFEILPAWYERTPTRIAAILLVAIAGASAAGAIQNRRSQRAADLMRSQFEATLGERTRIARELHDTLLQELTGITMLLSAFRQTLATRGVTDIEDLSHIMALAKRSLVEARQSVWDLRTDGLDRAGLGEQLAALVRATGADALPTVRLTTIGEPRALTAELEQLVLRVVREAINNALKHARARAIDVTVRYEPDTLTLDVADDGIGIADEQLERAAMAGHFGIVGMRERAANAGGSLVVSSTPVSGTTITLTLPR